MTNNTPLRWMSMVTAMALVGAACVPAQDIRSHLLQLPLTADLGGETTRPLATAEAFTFVAANATDATRAAFSAGNVIFSQQWLPADEGEQDRDGLGPVFNRAGCSDCHINNGRGRAPAAGEMPQSLLVRLSVPARDTLHAAPQGVPGYGSQVQDRAVANVPAEAQVQVNWEESAHRFADGTPYRLRQPNVILVDPQFGPLPADTLYSVRVASQLIGLGLLERVPVQTLHALADPHDQDRDGISGRTNLVFSARDNAMAVGRFGWKANSPDLASQNAAAAIDDMGISSPLAPLDNCVSPQSACTSAASHDGIELSADGLVALTAYTEWLAVPRQRNAQRPNVRRGFETFVAMDCATCHVPTLITGADILEPGLSEQVIHPFTDLLLHDMGEGLADNRPDYQANGREWRTPPLWGIGLTQKVSGHTEFLHDGRARSLAEAILWHSGEAEVAREEFRTGTTEQRSLLLEFLNSL
jgi:CxxC motif-containing protein (DUF1111 family)